MATYSEGDEVTAVMDIGGFARDHVPKGSPGVVTEAGWSSLKVRFTVAGGFLSSDRRVEISVNENEIR